MRRALRSPSTSTPPSTTTGTHFAAAAKRRFGVDLPYEQQVTWHIGRLRPEQVHACIVETHAEADVLSAEPYPGAVDTVTPLARGGPLHPHHDPPRRPSAHGATERWLERIGLAYDELYCSLDKVTRCRRSASTCSIDDSPVNLAAGDRRRASRGATIVHPWNRDLIEEEDVIAADGLARARARTGYGSSR